MDTPSNNAFALLVTDGTVLEYPPELYTDASRAEAEGDRWAWVLSAGLLTIEQPFEGRWSVGDRDVRLVPVKVETLDDDDLWVAQYWNEDGYPDPEALVIAGREAALDWIKEPPAFEPPIDVIEKPWFVGATYLIRGEEAYAVASLAKVVR